MTSLHSLPAGTEQGAEPSGDDDDWWEDALQAVLPWLCGSDGRDILENAPGMLDDADDAEVNMLMRVRQSEGESWLSAGLFNGQLYSLEVTLTALQFTNKMSLALCWAVQQAAAWRWSGVQLPSKAKVQPGSVCSCLCARATICSLALLACLMVFAWQCQVCQALSLADDWLCQLPGPSCILISSWQVLTWWPFCICLAPGCLCSFPLLLVQSLQLCCAVSTIDSTRDAAPLVTQGCDPEQVPGWEDPELQTYPASSNKC